VAAGLSWARDGCISRPGEDSGDQPDGVPVQIAHILGQLVPWHQVGRQLGVRVADRAVAPGGLPPLVLPSVVLAAREFFYLLAGELDRVGVPVVGRRELVSDGSSLTRMSATCCRFDSRRSWGRSSHAASAGSLPGSDATRLRT
jgi:hypothetical protein